MDVTYHAEEYDIMVVPTVIDGVPLWKAYASEWRDLTDFGDTPDEAHDLLLDSIRAGLEAAAEGHFIAPVPWRRLEDDAPADVPKGGKWT